MSGMDQVDAEELGFGEHHAGVDDDDVVADRAGPSYYLIFLTALNEDQRPGGRARPLGAALVLAGRRAAEKTRVWSTGVAWLIQVEGASPNQASWRVTFTNKARRRKCAGRIENPVGVAEAGAMWLGNFPWFGATGCLAHSFGVKRPCRKVFQILDSEGPGGGVAAQGP